jgi:succinoglycan biosynthesis transport protein ExoP
MEQQHTGPDLQYILHTLLGGKWIILSVAVLALVLAILSNYFQVHSYRSWAQIQIDAPPYLPNPGSDIAAQSSYYSNVDKYFNTEKEKLQSRRMMSLFAEQLHKKDPTYQSMANDAIAGEMAGGLSVVPVEDTNLLNVLFTTNDYKKAADWLNQYLDLFVEENRLVQGESVKQSQVLLQSQLDEIKGILAAQQGQVNQYAEKLGGTPGATGYVDESDFLYRDQIAYEETRRKRLDQEEILKKMESYLNPGSELGNIPNFEFSSGLQALFERLREARATLDQLRLSGKGEEHPSIAAKKLDIRNLEAQMHSELQKSVDSMRLEISVLKGAEERALQGYKTKLAERRAKASQIQEVSRLDRAREAWISASNLVEEKLRSLKVIGAVYSNNIRIVERASPDPSPIKKRGARFAALMGVLGAIFGCGLVIAGESLNPKVRSLEDIQTSLNLAALGFLPKARDFSTHETREAYNTLRTEILFRRDTQQHRSFMITSSIPQEGKTTIAFNLARTLAEAGDRTVVLDFDLRKARLRSLVGKANSDGVGIFSPVEGLKLKLENTDTPALQVIVPFSLPENPPFLLSQPDIRELIEYLRGRFDWVLIDTPPVTSVTDAVIIAPLVDSILFVIKHNFVDKRIARNSLSALSKVNPNIMGAVLNEMDVKRMRYYAYQSYYRYHSES